MATDTFTPSAHVKLCTGCWEPFVISLETLDQQAHYAPELESIGELVDEIGWCQECVTGNPHPDERPTVPHEIYCPNEKDHVLCETCGADLCGRGQVDYHRAYGHRLSHPLAMVGAARSVCV